LQVIRDRKPFRQRPGKGGNELRLGPDVAATDVPNLSLPDHRHRLVARHCSSGRPKAAKAQPLPRQLFYEAMILLCDIVQVFHLPQP
jgi:hypothetical protein